MGFKFDNLWVLLQQKDMTKDELRYKIKSSQTTIVNLAKNRNVSLDIIDRICEELQCTPNDIMEYDPKETFINKKIFERGDVYLAKLFHMTSDEFQSVLIYQSQNSFRGDGQVMVIPFTTHIPSYTPQSRIIQPDQFNGLSQNSILLIDKMRAIRQLAFNEKLGKMNDDQLKIVDSLVIEYLGINVI